MMEKTLEQKIAHATKRMQHHLGKSSEWENKMVQCHDECEKARTRTYSHSDKAEIWNEELTQLLAIKKLQELPKDEDTRLHDVIEIRSGKTAHVNGVVHRDRGNIYINGTLCKSVFEFEIEKDICPPYIGSESLTTVTITFKVPDVVVK